MPRLAICSCDLHWHWINWTLLCDTMEVSMLCLAWLTTAQHVFQPALTGRLELVSRKIVSRGDRGVQISRKIVSRELGPRSYRDFAKNIAFLGAKKWGPTCDRDISNSTIYTTAIYREYTVLVFNKFVNKICPLEAYTRIDPRGIDPVNIMMIFSLFSSTSS